MKATVIGKGSALAAVLLFVGAYSWFVFMKYVGGLEVNANGAQGSKPIVTWAVGIIILGFTTGMAVCSKSPKASALWFVATFFLFWSWVFVRTILVWDII